MTRVGRCLDTDTFLKGLGAQIRAPFPRSKGNMGFQIISAQPHAFRAIKTDGSDIGRGEFVVPQHIQDCLTNLRLRERHRHAHDVRRIK